MSEIEALGRVEILFYGKMVNISILAVYKTSISLRIVAENGLGWVHHYTDELLEELSNTIVHFIRLFLFENGLCQITRFV